MSHEIDEYYKFYDESATTARKVHRCDACKEPILPKQQYMRIYIVRSDSDVENLKRCLRCQVIHEHLRTIGDSDMYPAERLDCGEEYLSHWGVPPPEPIARLAFATHDDVKEMLSVSRAVEGFLRALAGNPDGFYISPLPGISRSYLQRSA